MFNLIRWYQICFQSDCSKIYSHHPSTRMLITPHPHQSSRLSLSYMPISWIWKGMSWWFYLIFIYLRVCWPFMLPVLSNGCLRCSCSHLTFLSPKYSLFFFLFIYRSSSYTQDTSLLSKSLSFLSMWLFLFKITIDRWANFWTLRVSSDEKKSKSNLVVSQRYGVTWLRMWSDDEQEVALTRFDSTMK